MAQMVWEGDVLKKRIDNIWNTPGEIEQETKQDGNIGSLRGIMDSEDQLQNSLHE